MEEEWKNFTSQIENPAHSKVLSAHKIEVIPEKNEIILEYDSLSLKGKLEEYSNSFLKILASKIKNNQIYFSFKETVLEISKQKSAREIFNELAKSYPELQLLDEAAQLEF